MTESHVIRLVDGLKEMGMFRGKDRRVNGDALLVFVCMKDCDGGWGIVTDRSKCQVIEYNSLFEE